MELTQIIRRGNMKKRATKIPYEGYTLPHSAEKGGQFVDFNRVIQRKPIKTNNDLEEKVPDLEAEASSEDQEEQKETYQIEGSEYWCI